VPGRDGSKQNTSASLRGLVRAEDFLSRIGAAQPLKDVFEQVAFRHVAALSSLAGSLGSMPESANSLRMMRSRPSCLREHELGQLMSKLRVLAFLDVGLWANVP
jgi:hypothetical protein